MNIFDEFKEQLNELTDLRVGDEVYSICWGEVSVVRIKTLGFSIETNRIVINNDVNFVFYQNKKEADEVLRKSRIQSISLSIERKNDKIEAMKEELVELRAELRGLIFRSNETNTTTELS